MIPLTGLKQVMKAACFQ